MRKRVLILFFGCCLLLLYGAFKIFYPTYSWHQKLTLEVYTPNGVKSAYTVNYVGLRKVATPSFLGYNRVYEFSGEAIALELAPKKVLFVLLSGVNYPSQEGLAWAVFDDLVPGPPDLQGQVWFDGASNISRATETRVVPRALYPLLMTFGDLSNPASFKIVDPENLGASFGPGYAIKQMTLSITGEELTKGVIDPFVPWSTWSSDQWLRAGNGDSPMQVKIGEITYMMDSSSFRRGKR